MFDHEAIEIYNIEEVPLGQDIYLMDEKWLSAYEHALLEGLRGREWDYGVGYISYAAAHGVTADGLELSWYPNIHTRFHEMRVNLPRAAFIICVGCSNYDEKPRIFVKSEWLTDLHLRTNSVFAMVDAIGVKNALAAGNLTTPMLDSLRERIDEVAAQHQDIAFVSFADSLLLKTNWSIGQVGSSVKYTYEPERIVRVLPKIADAFRDTLGLRIYVVITQGRNEFYRDELIHVSPAGNHLSLNSLGLPFAQLQAIEHAARAAIRGEKHSPAELYMDDQFFHSLNLRFDFDKHKEPAFHYSTAMTERPCQYIVSSFQTILENIRK